MAQEFFIRLKDYYRKVAEVLRGDAETASIFPNTTDIGQSRELFYAKFLRSHAPSKCNVFLGGFLFHDGTGAESKQMDVIVTTDTTPQFYFPNIGNAGKSFSPVEGTLAVASIKSTLDNKQLIDALDGLASIPPTRELGNRKPPNLNIQGYEDWPFKIIYANDGIAGETLLDHLNSYYRRHPEVDLCRRPNIIHVAGKYLVLRIKVGTEILNPDGSRELPEIGAFHMLTYDSDVHAIVWVLNELQHLASASTHILFNYNGMLNRVVGK